MVERSSRSLPSQLVMPRVCSWSASCRRRPVARKRTLRPFGSIDLCGSEPRVFEGQHIIHADDEPQPSLRRSISERVSKIAYEAKDFIRVTEYEPTTCGADPSTVCQGVTRGRSGPAPSACPVRRGLHIYVRRAPLGN